MKKKSRSITIFFVSLVALMLSFLAGALFYRAGLLSKIKNIWIEPPTPTPTKITTQPDFEFAFLPDPKAAAMNSLPLPANQEPLSFLVAGHIYGKPGDEEFHPSPTLLVNIGLLKNLQPDFVVLLGDTVWKPSRESFDLLDTLILRQFGVPVYNAVGNHDVTKRDLYQSRYGTTVFAFRYKNQLFIFLDTTLSYYQLTPDQYLFITKTIQDHSPQLEAIHIFMHHMLFLEEDQILGKGSLKPNEGNGYSPEFRDFLEKWLIPLSRSFPIFIYAGDVGAFEQGNLSPLYEKIPGEDIFFLATGLGNNDHDSILYVVADDNGFPQIKPISLTGKDLNAIEYYSFDYWFTR